jgi:hypothetical protein
MVKNHVTSKSSRPTVVRHNTPQALARAITCATNPALLRKIVNTSAKMEDLAIRDRGPVDTTELAATILIGKETRRLVEHLTRSDDEQEIADVLGCVIAASQMAGRA